MRWIQLYHTPGAALITWPIDLQSSTLPLRYGCPLNINTIVDMIIQNLIISCCFLRHFPNLNHCQIVHFFSPQQSSYNDTNQVYNYQKKITQYIFHHRCKIFPQAMSQDSSTPTLDLLTPVSTSRPVTLTPVRDSRLDSGIGLGLGSSQVRGRNFSFFITFSVFALIFTCIFWQLYLSDYLGFIFMIIFIVFI